MSPSVDDAGIAALERIAFRAWPAETVEDIGGWSARFTRGVTRRGNSVAPLDGDLLGPADPATLPDRIDRVERFYADRKLEPLFQLGAQPQPGDLDARLAARGYETEAAVTVQIATPSDIVSTLAPARTESTRVDPGVTSTWLDVAVKESRFKDVPEVFEGFLQRIGDRALFPLARIDGKPACAALLVCEPPWAGLYAMVTAPEFRRRGVARRLMRGIGEWAQAASLAQLYLLVEDDNDAARSLYRGAGFRPQYAYHYRRLRG